MKWTLAILAIALPVVGGALYGTRDKAVRSERLRTAAVGRGDLVLTIEAAGTVEPEEVVEVSPQVVGRIKSLGLDPGDPQGRSLIDNGSPVREGDVLAVVDDAGYKAQVDEAEAALQRAQADLAQAQARLDEATGEWTRAKSLLPTSAIARSDYDAIACGRRAALAHLAAEQAGVRQGETMLRLARMMLDNTVIRSPVQGVILDRRVNVGQTVVANALAPSLFVIARDLRRMHVRASVRESDIGRLRTGMPAQFAVTSYPGEIFRGKVVQVRLKADARGGAVVCTAVIAADNSDGRLRPHMTASLHVEIGRRRGVLMVPNTALRWRPRPDQLLPGLREALPSALCQEGEEEGQRSARGLPGNTRSPGTARSCGEGACLWVPEGRSVRPVRVQVGDNDGSSTEVSGGDVKEGMNVVVGEGGAAAKEAATVAESDAGGEAAGAGEKPFTAAIDPGGAWRATAAPVHRRHYRKGGRNGQLLYDS